jgi:hypothetical protein
MNICSPPPLSPSATSTYPFTSQSNSISSCMGASRVVTALHGTRWPEPFGNRASPSRSHSISICIGAPRVVIALHGTRCHEIALYSRVTSRSNSIASCIGASRVSNAASRDRSKRNLAAIPDRERRVNAGVDVRISVKRQALTCHVQHGGTPSSSRPFERQRPRLRDGNRRAGCLPGLPPPGGRCASPPDRRPCPAPPGRAAGL